MIIVIRIVVTYKVIENSVTNRENFNFTHWIAWNIKQGQNYNYRYTIYSLDNTLELLSNSMKKKLLKTMNGYILQ